MFAFSSSVPMNLHPNMHSSLPIPMIYDAPVSQSSQWEYHVLTVNTQEGLLPDAGKLNELGAEGWLMVGLHTEHSTDNSSTVYYYFIRQQQEKK